MYCRWEINVWATEVGWCFPFMFVSQWWLVSWLLRFTRFAQSHFSSLSGSFWMTHSLHVALRQTDQSCQQTCHGCAQSHCPTDPERCILLIGICSLQMAWSEFGHGPVVSTPFISFPRKSFYRCRAQLMLTLVEIYVLLHYGGVFHWTHRPILFCLCFHCLCWDFSSCVLWYNCHWYGMGKRDIVIVYQIRAADPKGMW